MLKFGENVSLIVDIFSYFMGWNLKLEVLEYIFFCGWDVGWKEC